MTEHIVLRVVTKFIIPFILMYALYVQFHGELSAGGGFQAGVIFAAAFILHALVFGLEETQRALPLGVVKFLASVGVLIYGGVGVVALCLGGNYLDYSTLLADPAQGQKLGVTLIEIGVGMTVFSVMVLIYYVFAGREDVVND